MFFISHFKYWKAAMRSLWSLLLSSSQLSPKSFHCTAQGAVSSMLLHTVTLLFLDRIALFFSQEDDEPKADEVVHQYFSP